MELSTEIIKQAYLFLKSYVYHENLNFFLKHRVAAFECGNFEEAIDDLKQVLNCDDPLKHPTFNKWIEQIDFRILPKTIVRPDDQRQNDYSKAKNEKGIFLSNVSVSHKYVSKKINYFIDAPIELQIIDVLWCTIVGPALEEKLTKDCYGNRLHQTSLRFLKNLNGEEPNYRTGEIFKRYIEQYSAWRDQALNCATELAEEGNDVGLLSLDLKSYYYHIEVDFKKINNCVNDYFDNNEPLSLTASVLTKLLVSMSQAYTHLIEPNLLLSHPDCSGKAGLPIGFASSSILSNWYLSEFDNNITDSVRPAYYGRYVDDILMVFKKPKIEYEEPVQSFIKKYLTEQIDFSETNGLYEIKVGKNRLPIQPEKLILQFFDKHHSRAGLEVFKKEIEERSSAFKFLPIDDVDKELDQFAYDVLYDGSINKLRSVVGLAENETELARYLSSHITAHRLCKLDKKDLVLPQLKMFFLGVNALNFSRLWEKVYQYAVILNRPEFVVEFYVSIKVEISKIEFKDSGTPNIHELITTKIRQDLELYNKLSLSICIGLLNIDPFERLTLDEVKRFEIRRIYDFEMDKWPDVHGLKGLPLFSYNEDLNQFVRVFRHANLIRHNLVAWPLANYTDYTGDLTDEVSFRSHPLSAKLNKKKIDLTPRFIHFDEWQVFSLNTALTNRQPLNEWHRSSLNDYNSQNYWDEFPVEYDVATSQNNNSITISTLTAGRKIKKTILRVAIANLQIAESDIEAAVRKDMNPNLSFQRQSNLYQVLNDAVREKADLLVMPEVAIPVSWLPFMITYARRHQIGLVFGLEHWVVEDHAYNLLIEALPFRVSGKYKSCVMTARIKNHYAPAELEMLDSVRLISANQLLKAHSYHLVKWNGVCFATYNCFELSDIEHRSIFKSEIDMLVACVWNKDTNYYEHILESAVRDLHCYVIQSNTSQYGGSCVLRPTNTESKTMIYVKGGSNSCVLTADIDIKSLREFHFKSKPSERDNFKPLPPGYSSEKVLNR